MRVWPQFRSALPWDLVAVTTYFTISFVFLYVGMIPDLAKLRDSAPSLLARRAYGVMAIGWRGTAREWWFHRIAYGLLAGLATPLVISVHSIVSMDFATSVLPGWHSTVFPPYFVAGALFSGFGMVATILIVVRRWFGIENVITTRHLDAVAKMMLITAWMVSYGYFVENLLAPSSEDPTERFLLLHVRPFGPHAVTYWIVLACNFLIPQALWSKRVRVSPALLFIISITTNVGMWTERFMLIVTSLERDFLPSSWGRFVPSLVDLALLVGTFGLFATLMMAFMRLFPFVPVHEVQKLAHEEQISGVAA
jgi:molybdopterin-containing oxidoreductase family membrane subunit